MAKPEGKYYPGQWLFYCDVCNKKMLSGDARRRWDGLYVCEADWEPRHPSDFIRARKETSNQLPWARPGNKSDALSVAPAYSLDYLQYSSLLDLKYYGTGFFYWYDTTSVYPAPEAYVTGDYY